MLKRISLLLAISLHTLMWGGVTSEAASQVSPKRFSRADIFKPFQLPISKVSSSDVLKALGKFLPVIYQKGITSNQTFNCPPCPEASYHIGDFAQGGVVIWLTSDGLHGLVAAIDDAAKDPVDWGPDTIGYIYNNQPLPLSTPNDPYGQYYGGYQNQTDVDPTGLLGFPAFYAAANYSITVKGVTYEDWWLPSSRELSLMYAAVGVINEVSTANKGSEMQAKEYWSSRENNDKEAWYLDFNNGYQDYTTKNNNQCRVRCVRAF